MQPTLFDDQRLSADRAIQLSIDSFNEYGSLYDHWAISFSGGKDSTTVVTLLAVLLEQGHIKRPKSISVMYADTGLEITPLHLNALQTLESLKKRGFSVQVVRPKLDDRFFVYMLGRGVPPPQPGFRWCVGNLKLEPMEIYLKSLHTKLGQRFLTFTGVRVGESAARDQRIAIACTKDGAECSQGHLQYSRQTEKVSDLCHPIIHWRVCQIWEWLIRAEVEFGFPTYLLAETYGGDEAVESNARTGCIQCNVAKRDMALESLTANPKWKYLSPLLNLREVYHTLSMPYSRHRKQGGEVNADGRLCKNQNRLGPLTMAARKHGLTQVLAIQNQVNEAAIAKGMPTISLISEEELQRIYWSWENNLYPQKWDGSEPIGSELMPSHYADGSIQNLLWAAGAPMQHPKPFYSPRRLSIIEKPEDYSDTLALIQARLYILTEFLHDRSWEALPLAALWESDRYEMSIHQYHQLAEQLRQHCCQIYAQQRRLSNER